MIDADEISRARAISIEHEIARRGIALKRQGRELVGPCPRCAGRDRFGISISKQLWNCRGCQIGGDVIALVQHLDGVDFGTAIETLTGASPRQTVSEPPESRDHESEQHRKAAWLWSHRQPIEGTPAERYLREARGYGGPILATLAYLPPSPKYPEPKMIAAFGPREETEPGIIAAPRKVEAVHLTLLKADGSGKADVEPNKQVIGSPRGLPIVLAPPNDLLGLAVTEGIEDGLSAHEATGLGAWAAYCAGNMEKLAPAIPSYVETVTICAHNDDAGQRAAYTLAEALTECAIETFIEGIGP
jgi:phage/plasmid primase-like uncharacterized protein